MPLPDPYAINIQRGVNADRNSEIRSVAQFGAEQLGKYGQEGQMWAERLKADPRAALAMAQEYGGFGAIEQSLRYGEANSRGATASELARLGLRGPGGSAAFAQIAQGEGNLQEASQLEGLSGLQPGELIDHYMRYDPAKGKIIAKHYGMAGLEDEAVRAVASRRTKESSTFDELFRAVKSANAADVESPEWGQALTILMNKVLQPNSAVLEGEANATARSLQSLLENMGATVNGVFNPQTPLSLEGRRRVLKIINELARTAAKDYTGRHEGWKRANAEMGIKGPNDLFSRPGYERLEEVESFVGGLKDPTVSRGSAPVPVGTRKQFTDPDTGEAIEVIKVDGGWNRVN